MGCYVYQERVSNIAYNVINGLCTSVKDPSAPVYITIGDAGYYGVTDTNMTQPQPEYSAFREASFGHGIFDIKTEHMLTTAGTKIKMELQWRLITFGFSTDTGTQLMIPHNAHIH
ncbi:hypothetical protein ACSQ67_021957 [Phaseolus vulgaris]